MMVIMQFLIIGCRSPNRTLSRSSRYSPLRGSCGDGRSGFAHHCKLELRSRHKLPNGDEITNTVRVGALAVHYCGWYSFGTLPLGWDRETPSVEDSRLLEQHLQWIDQTFELDERLPDEETRRLLTGPR